MSSAGLCQVYLVSAGDKMLVRNVSGKFTCLSGPNDLQLLRSKKIRMKHKGKKNPKRPDATFHFARLKRPRKIAGCVWVNKEEIENAGGVEGVPNVIVHGLTGAVFKGPNIALIQWSNCVLLRRSEPGLMPPMGSQIPTALSRLFRAGVENSSTYSITRGHMWHDAFVWKVFRHPGHFVEISDTVRFEWFTLKDIEESGAEMCMVSRQMVRAVMGKL